MRTAIFFRATLAVVAAIVGVCNLPAQAIQLADGTVYFAQPPRLIATKTTQSSPGVWATYYFTINLPDNAGEPLQRVTFKQQLGPENIQFDLKDSRAFEGTPANKGQRLKLKEVTVDRATQTISVTFASPVPPGRTITLGLRPVQNPLFGGVYLFRVTAFPAGEKSFGQFLGIGRIQFSIPGGRG